MIPYKVRPRKNPVSQQVKYYAAISAVSPMKQAEVVDIISRMCTVSGPDVKAVLDALQIVVLDSLRNGCSVRLGDLGSFRPTLISDAEDEAAAVSAASVKYARCVFTPSAYIRNGLRADLLSFRQVAVSGD